MMMLGHIMVFVLWLAIVGIVCREARVWWRRRGHQPLSGVRCFLRNCVSGGSIKRMR